MTDYNTAARPQRRTFGEAGLLLKIALPLATASLAEFAMIITSKLVVGDLGYYQLAAVGLSGTVSFDILFISMGLLSIAGVLAAHAEGAGRRREAGHAARQGMIVAAALAVPVTLAIWFMGDLLALAGQDEKVAAFARIYSHGFAGALLPILWFTVLRNFVSALSRPTAVMVISAGAVVANYLLTTLLVHGAGPVPALGVFGAGLSFSVVSWVMLVVLVWHVYATPALRGYGLFSGRLRFDGKICSEIFRLGLPVAGIVGLEASLFVTADILSGIIGAQTLAAYEVVISWAGIPFVIALGFGEATMVRVAQEAGRGAPAAARRAGVHGMIIGVVAMALMTVVPVFYGEHIARIFISGSGPGAQEVVTLVVQLLIIVAVFQVFDGLQAIASRALRGVKDSTIPLWIAGFGYWVIGIGGGSILAFPLAMKGAGLWWGMAGGLTITGGLLAWRFVQITGARRLGPVRRGRR